MNATPLGWNVADFEYLPEQSLLLVPTFLDNRVRTVRIRTQTLLASGVSWPNPEPCTNTSQRRRA